MGSKLNEDYGDTVPSRPLNVGFQDANQVLPTSTLRKQHKLEDMEEGIARIVYFIFRVEFSSSHKWILFSP